MTALLARYDVADAGRFLEAFDDLEATRREHGSTGHVVLRSPDEPGTVVVLIRFDSRDQAERFAASPERAAALRRATVAGRQDEILDVARAQGPG
jgi:heme-degrading monooxygenase HmoA